MASRNADNLTPHHMKKIKLLIGIAAVSLAMMLPKAYAGFPLPGGGVYVTVTTNTLIGLTNSIAVQMPQVFESITGITNGVTQCTNSLCYSFQTNGLNYTIVVSSVFNATSWGLGSASIASPASWSTNYPAASFNLPAYGFFQVAPQSGGTNTFTANTF